MRPIWRAILMTFVFTEPKGIGLYAVSGWNGARAYFTTRRGGVSSESYCCLNLGSGGGDSPEKVDRNLDLLCAAVDMSRESLVRMDQVHSDSVHVLRSPDEEMPDGGHDATVTDVPGVALGVLVADCVPILLHDPVKRVVGAVHAGWKGTVAGVAAKAVKTMAREYGSSPRDILAAIGPAIGPCCYEVDERVIRPLGERFGDIKDLVTEKGGGKWLLDLWKANTVLLTGAGLVPDNIASMGLCTSCNNEMFYSYRRDGRKTGRMMGLVMLED